MICAAALAALAQRSAVIWIYRKWFRQGFAGDAAFHFAVVEQLKQDRKYAGVPQFLIKDEADTYPILFHRLAALLPLASIRKYQYLPNLILWTALVSALVLYLEYVGATFFSLPGAQFALAFFLFFLTTVSNLSLDMNGINYISLSERMLSRFAAGFYFLALSVYMTYGDNDSLVVAVVAGTVTFLSSMFGRQSIAFVTPLVCLGSLSFVPLLIAVLSALLSIAIDGKYFLRGIRHMVQFSHGYFHHVRHSRYVKLGHNRFINLRTVFGSGIGRHQRLAEIEQREPTRLLFRYPELILLGSLLVAGLARASSAELVILVATLAVYLATTTKALRHLGEANRYIEFNLWMLPSFMLARQFLVADTPPYAWVAYFAWVGIMSLRAYWFWSRLSFPDHDRLSVFIEPLALQRSATIFAVPFTLGAAINARVKCNSLMYQGSAVNLALYNRFMEEAPFLKRDWQRISCEYQVTHIFAEKSYLAAMKGIVGWEYDFSALPIIAESESYIVFEQQKAV
jgi:hypothetical protein